MYVSVLTRFDNNVTKYSTLVSLYLKVQFNVYTIEEQNLFIQLKITYQVYYQVTYLSWQIDRDFHFSTSQQ